MAKFRKKATAVVEAEQWFPGKAVPGVREPSPGDLLPYHYVITAHNQVLFLDPGDWIIPGPGGRGHCPVKPDIFADTYEPAE